MASPTEISASQLTRLAGLPDAPTIVDVRDEADFAADPRLLPAATRRDFRSVQAWARDYSGRRVVVVCQKGRKLSQGVAAWLRHEGLSAETLTGGFEAWRDAGGALVDCASMPVRDANGRTVWVTRARPKIDRIACPWLIRRFIDPAAVILYVESSEVEAVSERFGAAAFDVDGVFWSHRDDMCTFDTMLREFGLRSPALDQLATIIRAADTARPELSPQAAGLLAVSLGLSRMFRDDLEQLDAGMLVYDALYRWCRDATDETHNWPAGRKTA